MACLVARHFLDLGNGDVVEVTHNFLVLLKHLNLRWLRLTDLLLGSDVISLYTRLATWLPWLESEFSCQARLDLLA